MNVCAFVCPLRCKGGLTNERINGRCCSRWGESVVQQRCIRSGKATDDSGQTGNGEVFFELCFFQLQFLVVEFALRLPISDHHNHN